ncbi:MAG: hypothetical protein BroJett006_13120 [Betaproteobacteria bacterium]|nr:MAG: hypothetical protein BroJett006_13120 [Betaproteobacteria bacterium]
MAGCRPSGQVPQQQRQYKGERQAQQDGADGGVEGVAHQSSMKAVDTAAAARFTSGLRKRTGWVATAVASFTR